MIGQARHVLARAVARIADLDQRIVRGAGRYVMAYHRVIPRSLAERDHVHHAMWISPERFEAQIRWMRSIGEIVTWQRALDFDQPSSKPLFALTFDDGWIDTFETAFPLLRQHDVPALVFLVSDAVNSGDLFWPEDVVTKTQHHAARAPGQAGARVLADLWPNTRPLAASLEPADAAEAWVEALKTLDVARRSALIDEYFSRLGVEAAPLRGYIMSWEQAGLMQQAGVDFGSHTHTHRILKNASPAETDHELVTSRDILQSRLGRPIETFCYPNARYNGREGPHLRAAGYRFAFRIDGDRVRAGFDPFYIPRYLVSERAVSDLDAFRLHLLRAPLFVGRPNDPSSRDGAVR